MRTFAAILASLSVMRFTEEQMITILREAAERSMPAVRLVQPFVGPERRSVFRILIGAAKIE